MMHVVRERGDAARGCSRDPDRGARPRARRAISAPFTCSCRSSTATYASRRTSRRNAAISRHVATENGTLPPAAQRDRNHAPHAGIERDERSETLLRRPSRWRARGGARARRRRARAHGRCRRATRGERRGPRRHGCAPTLAASLANSATALSPEGRLREQGEAKAQGRVCERGRRPTPQCNVSRRRRGGRSNSRLGVAQRRSWQAHDPRQRGAQLVVPRNPVECAQSIAARNRSAPRSSGACPGRSP